MRMEATRDGKSEAAEEVEDTKHTAHWQALCRESKDCLQIRNLAADLCVDVRNTATKKLAHGLIVVLEVDGADGHRVRHLQGGARLHDARRANTLRGRLEIGLYTRVEERRRRAHGESGSSRLAALDGVRCGNLRGHVEHAVDG